MFNRLTEDVLDALRDIDRAFVIEQLTHARDSLPFDYRAAVAYGAIGLGAYTFTWLLYHLVTEPKHEKRRLLISAERAFYKHLKEAAHPFSVYPKTTVSSVVTSKSLSPRRRQKAQREIAPLRFDYTICDEHFTVLVAIDLRHRKLYYPATVRRGMRLKKRITKSAIIPYQRFDIKRPPTQDQLRQWLSANLPQASPPTPTLKSTTEQNNERSEH